MIEQILTSLVVLQLILSGDAHIFKNNYGSLRTCNPNYLKNAHFYVATKGSFQYNTWHTYETSEAYVTFLQIRNENVKEICKDFLPGHVNEVIFLNISLEYIEPGYFNSDKLEQVFIQGNNLTKIIRGIFNATSIRSLVLNDNNIHHIEANAFENMLNLEAISLDYNHIKKWDSSWFHNARFLFEVSMKHNLLYEIPESATKYLSESVEKLTRKYDGCLILDNNQIEYIHMDAFKNLQHFGTISLNNNKILELSEKVFRRFRFLFTLYMNSNAFICFTNKTVASFHGVKRLFLGDNKLNTECVVRLQKFFDIKGDSVFF